MIGALTSVQNGPERNVKLVVTPTEVHSEISSPCGSVDPRNIEQYEVTGLGPEERGLITLTFVLRDQQRVQFYCTDCKLDMALLLDQLDAAIAVRRRKCG
jgi:hypothetical protein